MKHHTLVIETPLIEEEAKELMDMTSMRNYAVCLSVAKDLSCKGFPYEVIKETIKKINLRNGEQYIRK